MRSKVAYSLKLARSLGEERRSPAPLWLCLRMATWALLLRLLHPVLPVRWLAWLALPSPVEPQFREMETIAGLHWLERSGLVNLNGLCLPRALVYARFLALAGLEPTLLIGFDGARGHAWVELDEKAFLEKEAEVNVYRSTLKVPPRGRELERN